MGFILFLISFLLVFASSYFITALVREKSIVKSLIYFVLIFVSQIIIEFEVLSILKSINTVGVLSANAIIFLIAGIVWLKKSQPKIELAGFKAHFEKIKFAVLRDKFLLALSISFVLMTITSLFLVIVAPSNNYDCMVYHLAKVGFWLQNQTMAHFDTPSLRQIVFPINSEILIMWPMTFLKRDFLAVSLQFFAGFGCLFLVYNYLNYLKVTTRRNLWTILILASFPAFIVEITSTQINTLLAFFLLCSFYLFLRSIKENDVKALIFSAIAFSISIGVKSTAFFFIPLFAILFIAFFRKEKVQNWLKHSLTFISVGIVSFLLLSSYNYILNYIDFGNPFSAKYHVLSFSIKPSIDAFVANLIRYTMLFVDFSGIKHANVFTDSYLSIKDGLFSLLSIENNAGLKFTDVYKLNTEIDENFSKLGILGFILFLPLIFRQGITALKGKNNKKFYLTSTAYMFIGFLILISGFMAFAYWNNRYLWTAVILSAPILALSYKRKAGFLKILITTIACCNLVLIPFNIDSKPFFKIVDLLCKKDFITARQEIRLTNYNESEESPNSYVVRQLAQVIPDNSRIGFIFANNNWYYPLFEENPTWKISPLRYEILAKNKNFDDYDYLVIFEKAQKTDIFEENIEFNYRLNNAQIVFDKKDNKKAIYMDRNGNVLFSGNPVFKINHIDFKLFFDNFKFKHNIVLRFQTGPQTEHKIEFLVLENLKK